MKVLYKVSFDMNTYVMFFCTAVLLSLNSVSYSISLDEPEIVDGYILMPDGRKIKFPDVGGSHVQEYSLHKDLDSKVLHFIRQAKRSEDDEISLVVFDFSGRILYQSEVFFGRVHYLERSKKIVLAKYSSHFYQGDSVMFDFDGTKLSVLDTPEAAASAGVSIVGKEEYIWFIAENLIEADTIELKVFSSMGEVVFHEKKITNNSLLTLGDARFRVDLYNLNIEEMK